MAESEEKSELQEAKINLKTPKDTRISLWKVCAPFFALNGISGLASVPEGFQVDCVAPGISTILYKATLERYNAPPLACLVRMYGASLELVDRARERIIVQQLGKIGMGPQVYHMYTNFRLEAWLDARPLRNKEVLLDSMIPLIASRVAELLGVDMVKLSNGQIRRQAAVWDLIDRAIALAFAVRFDDKQGEAMEKKSIALKQLNLNLIPIELLMLRRDLQKTPSAKRLAFCHNDLLAGNLMFFAPRSPGDSGKLIFLDFEFSSYNPAAFDIANHFCECCGLECDWNLFPPVEKQERWLRFYLARSLNKVPKAVTDAEIKQWFLDVNAWVLASHLFWGIWAIVQVSHSLIDFDYLAYAKLRLDAYWQMKDSCLSHIAALTAPTPPPAPAQPHSSL